MENSSIDIETPPQSAPLPYDLLLLADPERASVERYASRGIRYEARRRDEVVGVAVILPLDDDSAELMNISVMPDEQGSGVGKALLRHAITEMRAAGYGRLCTGTGNSSLSQLAFYQKVGFRIIGVIPNHFTDNYPEPILENGILCQDMIRLALDLAPEIHGSGGPLA